MPRASTDSGPGRMWQGLPRAAVWAVPLLVAAWLARGLVTQDGAAHLFNGSLILRSLQGDPGTRRLVEVAWGPLPGWGGHLLLSGLLAAFPWRIAYWAVGG